jgi:hypothetical protein
MLDVIGSSGDQKTSSNEQFDVAAPQIALPKGDGALRGRATARSDWGWSSHFPRSRGAPTKAFPSTKTATSRMYSSSGAEDLVLVLVQDANGNCQREGLPGGEP